MFYPSILNKFTLFVFKCQLTPIILLNATTTLAWICWIKQKDKEAYFTGKFLKISPERKNVLHECHSYSISASWVICRMELKARLCIYQHFSDHYLALSNVHNSFINNDLLMMEMMFLIRVDIWRQLCSYPSFGQWLLQIEHHA